MKQEFLADLQEFKAKLRALRREVAGISSLRVGRLEHRNSAEVIATMWVEKIRSPAEHRFKLDAALIESTSAQMKKLHQLSRPNGMKSSYLTCLDTVLQSFDNNFVLPVQQMASTSASSVPSLMALIPSLRTAEDSDYLREAIACAQQGHHRAAVVMGWCAAVSKVRTKLLAKGFDAINAASRAVKAQNSGRRKNWNKEFNIRSEADLMAVPDADLIVLVEQMELVDGNQSQRLESCLQYRNHSAHPGAAPIEQPHVVSLFVDITRIVLASKKFE